MNVKKIVDAIECIAFDLGHYNDMEMGVKSARILIALLNRSLIRKIDLVVNPRTMLPFLHQILALEDTPEILEEQEISGFSHWGPHKQIGKFLFHLKPSLREDDFLWVEWICSGCPSKEENYDIAWHIGPWVSFGKLAQVDIKWGFRVRGEVVELCREEKGHYWLRRKGREWCEMKKETDWKNFHLAYEFPSFHKDAWGGLIEKGVLSDSGEGHWEITTGFTTMNVSMGGKVLYFVEEKDALDFAKEFFSDVEYSYEIRQIGKVTVVSRGQHHCF